MNLIAKTQARTRNNVQKHENAYELPILFRKNWQR